MGQPQAQTLVMVDERAIGTIRTKFVMVVGDDNRALYRSIARRLRHGLRIVASGLKSGDRRQWQAAGCAPVGSSNRSWPKWERTAHSVHRPRVIERWRARRDRFAGARGLFQNSSSVDLRRRLVGPDLPCRPDLALAMPISEYPDVVPPSVVVRATYPGANPR
jgi:hypothetical protein